MHLIHNLGEHLDIHGNLDVNLFRTALQRPAVVVYDRSGNRGIQIVFRRIPARRSHCFSCGAWTPKPGNGQARWAPAADVIAHAMIDARLDDDIAFRPLDRPPWAPSGMLLTGATGFVGAFVLAELLRQSSSVVRCLVRAEDEVHARERVTAVLRRFRLAAELDRMAAIPADLSQPLLGMTPPAFAGLAAQTDAVIHCAAGANAALSYSHLRAANVSGTRELLRLASAGNAAAFHHISTISAGELTEDGYPLSKWAAEQLVSEAARRGLHALTYRLGRVSAASRSGVWNDADTVARIIRGSVEISAFPAFGDQADQDWTPVDALAQLIRHLVCSPRERGKIFTISGVRVQYAQILAWTRSYGYTFSLLSPAAWARRVAQDPHNPASGLAGNVLRWLAQDGTRRGESVDDLNIGAAGIPHAADERAFHRMLDRLVADGLLAGPDQ